VAAAWARATEVGDAAAAAALAVGAREQSLAVDDATGDFRATAVRHQTALIRTGGLRIERLTDGRIATLVGSVDSAHLCASARAAFDRAATTVADHAALGADVGAARDALGTGAAPRRGRVTLERPRKAADLGVGADAAVDRAATAVAFDATLLARAGDLRADRYAQLAQRRADVGMYEATALAVGAGAAVHRAAAAVGDLPAIRAELLAAGWLAAENPAGRTDEVGAAGARSNPRYLIVRAGRVRGMGGVTATEEQVGRTGPPSELNADGSQRHLFSPKQTAAVLDSKGAPPSKIPGLCP
jgi:hypothetical protein